MHAPRIFRVDAYASPVVAELLVWGSGPQWLPNVWPHTPSTATASCSPSLPQNSVDNDVDFKALSPNAPLGQNFLQRQEEPWPQIKPAHATTPMNSTVGAALITQIFGHTFLM